MTPAFPKPPALIDPLNFSTGDFLTKAFAPIGDGTGSPGVKPWLFKIGGKFYAVLQSANPASLTSGGGGMWTSSDGISWTQLDAANGPAGGGNNGAAPMTCFYPGSGNIIYVAYVNNATSKMVFNTFNVGTGLWGVQRADVGGAIQFIPLHGGGYHLTGLSNGDLYLYYCQSGLFQCPSYFVKYSGGVWAAPVLLTTNAVNIYDSILTVITDSADRTHVIYEHTDASLPPGSRASLEYIQVDPLGVPSAPVTIFTAVQLGGGVCLAGNPQLLGDNLILPLVVNVIHPVLIQSLLGAGLAAPVWSLETVDPGGSTCPPPAQITSGCMCSVVEPGTQDLIYFWSVANITGDTAPQQIWSNRRHGGVWQGPILVYDYSLNPPGGATFYGSGSQQYIFSLTCVAGSFLLLATMPVFASPALGDVAGVALLFGLGLGGNLTVRFGGLKVYG